MRFHTGNGLSLRYAIMINFTILLPVCCMLWTSDWAWLWSHDHHKRGVFIYHATATGAQEVGKARTCGVSKFVKKLVFRETFSLLVKYIKEAQICCGGHSLRY